MIKRTHRFHGHNSIKTVYAQARTVRSSQLSLKYIGRSTGRSYRAAVVVSKKVNKRAVIRNRLRRQIYETIRLQEPNFNGVYDLVFTVFSDQLLELSGSQLRDLVGSLLVKAGVRPLPTVVTEAEHDIVKQTGN